MSEDEQPAKRRGLFPVAVWLVVAAPFAFFGLLVVSTAGGPSYPPEWLSWLSLALPLAGGALGIASQLRVDAAGGLWRRAGRALLVVLVAVLSYSVISTANRSMLEVMLGESETRPLGELRSLISAQQHYAASNRGLYGELACLEEPAACIPGYAGPAFLSAGWRTPPPWRWELRAGAEKQVPGNSEDVVYRGRSSYVVLAQRAGERTLLHRLLGVRKADSFCGDSSGRVCRTKPGRAPAVAEGRCAQNDPAYESCFD